MMKYCSEKGSIMKTFKNKRSLVMFWLVVPVCLAGCTEVEQGSAAPRTTHAPRSSTAGSDEASIALEMRRTRDMLERQESMRRWDEYGRKWEEMTEKAKQDAEEQTRITQNYMRRMTLRMRQLQAQRELERRRREMQER